MIRIIFCLMVALLAGCIQSTVTPQQLACLQTCENQLADCMKVCQNSCANCGVSATKSAANDFKQFKHQQCVQGAMVARELQSYRDPLQCRKTTCNCQADHKICLQSCTGIIHKRLQVPPTCC